MNINNEVNKNPIKIKNEFNSDLIISNLIKGICLSDFKKNKKNEGIHYNTLFLNRIKISIVNIPITNLIALGIFSQDTKSSIIRIFLLNMIISFLNYTGEKKDFFKSKFHKNNIISKMNEENFTNFLYSKIYDTFLSIPIQIHFSRIIKKIFKRRALYIKDIYYKNYFLIDLNNNKIVLSLETLHDRNNGKEPVLKISKQKEIWEEIIYHCHNLKNDYIKKNNMIFNGIDYQNFFVKIEYKVTYPRRNFIIKFLPLLNGMCIIHEYIQLKLSTFENKEKKAYNEKSIIYGYDAYDNIFRNSDNRYFENEHYILKQVHFFLIESLFCSNNSLYFFFILSREPKIYFSDDILEIIDNEIKKYLKNNNNNIDGGPNYNSNYSNEIINKLISILYEEYIQINNNEKNIHKSTSQIMNNKNKKNDLILKEIKSFKDNDKSFYITKNETLIILFNSIQFNKNINPNDITIDLNDERISQLRITHNENNPFPSPNRSELFDKNKRANSIRLSELLSEKISIKPSRETIKSKNNRDSKFPYDSEGKNDNYSDKPIDEFDENNIYKENSKRLSYKSNDNIININTNSSNNEIINSLYNDNLYKYINKDKIKKNNDINIKDDFNDSINKHNEIKKNISNIIDDVEDNSKNNNNNINEEEEENYGNNIDNINEEEENYENNNNNINNDEENYENNNNNINNDEEKYDNNNNYNINEDEENYENNNNYNINEDEENYENNKNDIGNNDDEFNDNNIESINNNYIKKFSSKKNLRKDNFKDDVDDYDNKEK